MSGSPLEIGFNNRFMTDALKAVEDEEVYEDNTIVLTINLE